MDNKKKLAEHMAELVFILRQKCTAKDMVIVKRLNITPAEFNCLLQFLSDEKLSVKNLAQRLHITPGGVTRIITSLERKGIIRRDIAPYDRRGILVSLTPEGQKVVGQIKSVSTELHGEILDQIEPEHQQAIVRAITMLIEALDSWLKTHQEVAELI